MKSVRNELFCRIELKIWHKKFNILKETMANLWKDEAKNSERYFKLKCCIDACTWDTLCISLNSHDVFYTFSFSTCFSENTKWKSETENALQKTWKEFQIHKLYFRECKMNFRNTNCKVLKFLQLILILTSQTISIKFRPLCMCIVLCITYLSVSCTHVVYCMFVSGIMYIVHCTCIKNTLRHYIK